MKNIVIVPVGDNIDSLYVGLKEFPTEKIILITPEAKIAEANNTKKDLEKFKMPVDIVKIKGNISSLEQLSKKTNMSLPLISYHVNGSSKSEGLKDLGLIETEERKNCSKSEYVRKALDKRLC